MAPRLTAAPVLPPPAVPSLTADPRQMSSVLGQYFNTFALWCSDAFAEKVPINQAVPFVLLLASDPPAGTTPKVFRITVNTAGAISATVVPLGEAP